MSRVVQSELQHTVFDVRFNAVLGVRLPLRPLEECIDSTFITRGLVADNSMPDCITIFILPPSRTELERRLRDRKTDSDAVIERRLRDALSDMQHWDEFDYVIINEDLKDSLNALLTILYAERMKRARQAGLENFVHGLLEV